jgi:hypothetical protein
VPSWFCFPAQAALSRQRLVLPPASCSVFSCRRAPAPVDLFSLLASQGPVILIGFCAAVVVLPPQYSFTDFLFSVFLCCVLGLIKLVVDFACHFRLRLALESLIPVLAVSRTHSSLREYFCCWSQCSVCVSHQLQFPAGSSRAADFPLPSH